MWRKLALVVSLLCGVGTSAAMAQTPDVRAGATQLRELKNGFVVALRQFAESAAGAYGDEGPRLRPDLDALQRALDAWDAAIARYESDARTATQTADVRAALGAVYLDRLRAADALREFGAASRLDPRRADVHELSAAAYDFVGDPQRALAERANTTAAFTRAALLRQISGVAPIFPPAIYADGFRRLARGQLADGLTQLRAALEGDAVAITPPASASVLAGARLRQGQLQAALTGLRLSSAPADGETQRVMGVAYWADEQYEKSIEALTAAVALNPRDERARITLADVLVAAGRRPEAARALLDVIALLPGSGLAHYRLGQLYQAESHVAEALEQYEQAAASAPLTGLDWLFDTIGGLYATQADFDRAALAYRTRAGVNPTSPDAHRKLAEILALQGANDAALAEYDVARSLDARDAGAHAGMAQMYLRLGRFTDAVRAAGDALALDPAQQNARFALGTALTRLGDTQAGQRELAAFQQQVDETAARRRHALDVAMLVSEGTRAQTAGNSGEAARLFQRALEEGSDNARVEVALATVLRKAGQPNDALAHLAKAIAADPGEPDMHKLAADIYGELGRQEERGKEEQIYQRLLAQRKEQRLKQRPLLR